MSKVRSSGSAADGGAPTFSISRWALSGDGSGDSCAGGSGGAASSPSAAAAGASAASAAAGAARGDPGGPRGGAGPQRSPFAATQSSDATKTTRSLSRSA